MADGFAALGERLFAYMVAGFAETDRKAAGAGAMFGREIGGEGIRLFVHQEIAVALAVERDVAALVLRHRGKAQTRKQIVQQLGIRGCEFHEFETIHPHGILELHGCHADVRLGAHIHSSCRIYLGCKIQTRIIAPALESA